MFLILFLGLARSSLHFRPHTSDAVFGFSALSALPNLVPRGCNPFGQHQGYERVPLDKGNVGPGDEIEHFLAKVT